jgi:predicted DNA-binding transcriptional regulator
MSTNQVAFKLIQEAEFLTPIDRAVFGFITSYTKGCFRHQEVIARKLSISVRTLQRSITRLLKRGLLVRTYGVFKRVTYVAVSVARQLEILKNPATTLLKNLLNKSKKRRKKPVNSSDLSPVSDLNTTPVSEPTKEIKKEEIQIKKDKNFFEQFSQKPLVQDFASKRNQAVSLLKSWAQKEGYPITT